MSPSEPFDRLVSSLTNEERRAMLSRLNREPLEQAPDYAIPDEQEAPDPVEALESLSVLHRLVLSIIGLLTGRRREDVVEAGFLRSLRRRLDRVSPDLVKPDRGVLGKGVKQRIGELSQLCAELLPFHGAVHGAKRSQAFAVLLGTIDPMVQEWIEAHADPARISQRNPTCTDRDVLRRMEDALEQAFERIAVSARSEMYASARFFDNLLKLIVFPFSKVLGAYPSSEAEAEAGAEEPVECAFEKVRYALSELDDLFSGLRQEFTPTVATALGIQYMRDRLVDSRSERRPESSERELESTVRRLRALIHRVLAVRRSLPLTAIIRVMNRNLQYRPNDPGGGEDWLSQVKSYYRELIDTSYERYSEERTRREITDELAALSGHAVDWRPEHYCNYRLWTARFRDSLSVLYAFHRDLFLPRIRSPLRILMVEGAFYKEQNYNEFMEALDVIGAIGEELPAFDARLAESGDLGGGMAAAIEEGNAERAASLAEEADRLARRLASRALAAIRTISSVLHGVLYGEPGGRYDTLSNLHDIGGRGNRSLLLSLESAETALRQATELISRAYDLENTGRR